MTELPWGKNTIVAVSMRGVRLRTMKQPPQWCLTFTLYNLFRGLLRRAKALLRNDTVMMINSIEQIHRTYVILMLTSPCIIIELYRMGLRQKFFLLTLFLFWATSASAQPWKPWQIATPRQVLPVPADGTTVNFPNVNLVAGMKYRVHASGSVSVSSGSDIADASYYILNSFLHFNPNVTPVSLKVRNGAASEDWFYNFWTASGFQGGNYQSNHIYDASIGSLGSALSFRFVDRGDPPSNYYNDNSGNILIDVARETPGIAIEKDTLDFGTVRVGTPKLLLDSIESYGIQGYSVDNVRMLGTAASKFTASSQRAVSFVLTEATNEFIFTYTPTTAGRDSAEFHIYSSNGFGADKEKIIYLYGNGFNTQLSFQIDTLDFGVIKTGTTKTLPDQIINKDNISVTVTGITAQTPLSPYSVTGAPVTVGAISQSPISVTFAPTTDGFYFEKFDVRTGDGSLFHFYAKGIAGTPKVFIDSNYLDFGRVILKQSRTLTIQFGNIGTAPLNVTSTKNTNPLEYSIVGNQGPVIYEPGHAIIYSITFSPQIHIPRCANHDGQFIISFDDGTSATITFKGCDHMPLDVNLKIDTMYYVSASQEVDVVQRLINPDDPLDSALSPVTSLTERINYDAGLFDLVSVSKGSLINSSAWNMNTTNSAGAVDISISSLTSHFALGGSLVILRFHAHAGVKVGQFTDLVQNNISFGNPLEPFATTDAGRITISDLCTPVRISSGSFATSIEQNNPNPFNPSTHLQFAVGKNSDGSSLRVRITLYDQLGRFAGVLVDEQKTPGVYDYRFDGSSYSSGAYMYVFEAGNYVERKTMILVK